MASKTKSAEGKYKLVVYDTFEGEFYSQKEYKTKEEALKSAKDKLKELERLQPSSHSGGQDYIGIQDRVFIQYPDGRMIRIKPE
ncbi:hypothetical protein Mia14_0317 [Candidatus Mancarchaeum acidiphilum]|uniref:Uncharacterized protein n=1 Tax=Candidatus Mancarchaeum acidiphilum TaxID=1920749 RepID=A0A218NMF9_9ARCH|nr:hypothetical protein [Candidatus Mancarchaeum acidiphilum]ASI13644.1 hypothetical protein Mia14_0317 [Candidatus Mancarchaeum acidiphilum]